MPTLLSWAAPEGRRGVPAGGWDDSAEQFAGGMAYIPRTSASGNEPTPPSHTVQPSAHPTPPHNAALRAPHGNRRRRRSRRGHRRRMGPVLAIAGIVAIIGAFIGIGGGLAMVWLMKDSPFATAVSPEEEAERSTFMAACSETLSKIDCGCLWRDARAAFTPEYRAAVLRLIDERRELPIRLQRIRSEKLLGPELAKTVWEATYSCARR